MSQFVTKDEHMRTIGAIVKLNRAMVSIVSRVVTLENRVAASDLQSGADMRTILAQLDDLGRRMERLTEMATLNADVGFTDPEVLLLKADVASDTDLSDHIKAGTFPIKGVNSPDQN